MSNLCPAFYFKCAMSNNNNLSKPIQCDNCCSFNIELTTNDKIYKVKRGNWPFIYYCNDCGCAVGCHKNSFIPLGKMADRQTRRLRRKAHIEFDKLWKNGLLSRSKAYNWLALQLNIDYSECHISWFSKDQLKDVVTLSSDYYTKCKDILLKRKIKNDLKKEKREQREYATERRNKDISKRKRKRR